MRNVLRAFVSVLAVWLAAVPTSAQPKQDGALPRLVLQITVDQLRGDLPLRYQDRFGPRGFRYLLEQGVWYTAANHQHSYTETIVGHTTLATGAWPSRHGMVANSWYDRATRTMVNNIVDANWPLVGTTSKGASPERILGTTLSDELMVTTAGRSKVYSVSFKDRGAVPLSGHAGKAFWFARTNCFVSSTFYYSAYPDWVTKWCDGKPANAYMNKEWVLLQPPRDNYVESGRDNRFPPGSPPEKAMEFLISQDFRRTIPHLVAKGNSFYDLLSMSPFMDELTVDFVKKLVVNEAVGKDAVPDYLAISFSTVDLISHWFSPSSMESEDNLLRLDQRLEELFTFIDREVGLANTLIVLSADHGGTEFPENLEKLRIPTGRVKAKTIEETANAALDVRYGVGHGFITYSSPYFWLNFEKIAAKKQNPNEVEAIIIKTLEKLKGVKAAIPTRLLPMLGDDPQIAAIRHNQFAGRSGDIYVVENQNWQIEPTPEPPLPPMLEHSAPWAYDTYVPIAFAGAGVQARRVARPVWTVDVAATLAVLLRTRPPSGCVGSPLVEVVGP